MQDLGSCLLPKSLFLMTNLALLSKPKFSMVPGGWVPRDPQAAKAAVQLIYILLLRRGKLPREAGSQVGGGSLTVHAWSCSLADYRINTSSCSKERDSSGAWQACYWRGNPEAQSSWAFWILVNETLFSFPFSLLSQEMQSPVSVTNTHRNKECSRPDVYFNSGLRYQESRS